MHVAIGGPPGGPNLPPDQRPAGPPGYSSSGTPPPGGYGPGGFEPPPGPPPPGASLAWSPTDAIAFGWNAISKDFAAVALPIAAATFLMSLPSMLLDGVSGVLRAALIGSGSMSESSSDWIKIFVMPFSFALTLATQAYFLGGIVRFSLRVARGEKPTFFDLLSAGPSFVPLVIGQLLFLAGVMLGLLLCAVPAVIFALGCQFFWHFVVDGGVPPVDALQSSWKLTQGHKVQLALLALLTLGVVLLGMAACCVGAFLVSAPVASLASAYVYLKLRGETPISLA